MLTPIDMKEWEKTCDAETLDALLEAASGSIK